MTNQTVDIPVRRTITVQAPLRRAFAVFTAGLDTWWPRTHYIGEQPMQIAVMEQRAGGRLFERAADGSECDWGGVLVWEPPHRIIIAWQITPEWKFDPDLSKCSEYEVRFIPEGDAVTRVELEHRGFERHGKGADTMRTAVDSPGRWTLVLERYAQAVLP